MPRNEEPSVEDMRQGISDLLVELENRQIQAMYFAMKYPVRVLRLKRERDAE